MPLRRYSAVHPPVAFGGCRLGQRNSQQRLDLIECEHDDGSVAMFQIRVQRSVFGGHPRRAPLNREHRGPALGRKAVPARPEPDPFSQYRPSRHSRTVRLRTRLVCPDLHSGSRDDDVRCDLAAWLACGAGARHQAPQSPDPYRTTGRIGIFVEATMEARSNQTLINDLLELVAALDRRVPRLEREGSVTSHVMRRD
jgi:hypothetical protein